MISSSKNAEVIKLSNYGGTEGFQKNGPEEKKQWQEILEWKNQYDQSKGLNKNAVYANKHYHTYPEIDMAKYSYNAKSNQYSDQSDQENDAYYKQNQYNDARYLRKYLKLQPSSKDEFTEGTLANKSIFFSICGAGAEQSYHYNGFEKYGEEDGKIPN
ncbi:hypothetical protein QG516_00265 [Pedobacter gandavensis]|uniref:hypothetical protein n=1 Tax=Pedobacter gandavensis TaxID=2679963 RepID=UPI00247A8296|nr:hypothetical protein [Pedobacter gandavensis]WGQ10087.1 hypothetical protein QG516_00265 [Pedobacter gandavensis]